MAGQAHQASARRRGADKGVRLAVYHASTNVAPHLAELRRTKRFKLLCFSQWPTRMRTPATAVEAVLWEFVPDRKPSLRRLHSIARGTPVVSYSVDPGRHVADRSRAIGFTTHLKAPLSPVEIEHQLALAAPVDLATRFRQFQPTLRRYLNRVGIIGEMTRAVNASMDPERVAEALAVRAAAWLPAPCWAVVVLEPTGSPKVMAQHRLVPSVEVATRALGSWVLRNSQEYVSANLQDDRRTPGAPALPWSRFRSSVVAARWPRSWVWTVGPRHETRKAHPRRSPCSAGSYSRLPFRSVTL